MTFPKLGLIFLLSIIFNLPITIFGQEGQDLVNGNLIQFNDNGAWCWYQDERAVIDTANQKLIVGSDGSSAGVGGFTRWGDVNAVIFDLNTRQPQLHILREGGGQFYCDDHNAPAFLIRPDGKYLSMYAAHFNDTSSYYRIYDTGTWGPENEFDWIAERPGGSNFQTTYSNLFYLSAENRTYNFVRGNNKSPNSMISDDMGDSWYYGGQLTKGGNVGYNNGYYKYCSNGVDRIDFIFTEYHPRDFNTSIYHGYIENGKSYKSDGTLVDNDIFDTDIVPTPADFTMVFQAGTTIGSMTLYRCWNADVQNYEDGSIAAIITARINNNTQGNDSGIDPDHAFIYCRYDGANWSYTYLCQAGKKTHGSEADYTGLGALHPNDPSTIYISTHVDPRTDEDITYREIFKGFTHDDGVTWTWKPITQNSNQHNFRPIIPKWDKNHMALLWYRGIYNSAGNYNAAIVGMIKSDGENPSKQIYTDADLTNTTLSDGSPLVTTGPDAYRGLADDQWHTRTGFGNGGSVLTSSETDGENAPTLKTQVTVSDTGLFDIWVNFWANPNEDWRIKAGLSETGMQIYRQMACKQVEQGDHNNTMILTGNVNTYLYQAYLGRIEITPSEILEVLIDDYSIQTGSSSNPAYSTARTWYDGVSYAKLYTNSEKTIVYVARMDEQYIDPETGEYADMPVIYALQDAGYNVITWYNTSLSTASQATVDTLNNADLVIMGRSSPSTMYGDHKEAWNGITAPILNIELWNCRSNRLNWFKSTAMVNGTEAVYDAIIDMPEDPVFEDVDTEDVVPWAWGPISYLQEKTAGNGTVLARLASDSSVIFVRFEPRVEFYEGAGDMPAGHRTMLGNGYDAGTDPPFNYYNWTVQAEPVFLAEVAHMVALGSVTSVEEQKDMTRPLTCTLFQNYPNPFNPITTIDYSLSRRDFVSIKIFNVLGQQITTLVNKTISAGSHSVIWNAKDVPSGVYLYQLTLGHYLATKKMLLVR